MCIQRHTQGASPTGYTLEAVNFCVQVGKGTCAYRDTHAQGANPTGYTLEGVVFRVHGLVFPQQLLVLSAEVSDIGGKRVRLRMRGPGSGHEVAWAHPGRMVVLLPGYRVWTPRPRVQA